MVSNDPNQQPSATVSILTFAAVEALVSIVQIFEIAITG